MSSSKQTCPIHCGTCDRESFMRFLLGNQPPKEEPDDPEFTTPTRPTEAKPITFNFARQSTSISLKLMEQEREHKIKQYITTHRIAMVNELNSLIEKAISHGHYNAHWVSPVSSFSNKFDLIYRSYQRLLQSEYSQFSVSCQGDMIFISWETKNEPAERSEPS